MMISILVLTLAVSAPDVTAVGVVVSPRADRSVAVLRSQGRTRVAGVGDAVFGGKIVAISRESVTLQFGEERHEVRLLGAAAASRLPGALAPPPAPLPSQPGERTFERREVERRVGEEMQRILSETTLLPVTSAGKVAGLTITRLAEGTVLTEVGLQSGDILTEVNGVPIDSMATLIALYGRLQGESVIHAQVLRNGQPVSLGVVLR